MRALVTGATGFLGHKLVDELLKQKWQMTAVGRNRAIGQVLENKGATFLAIDLTDSQRVTQACRSQDLVFHCGALSSPWGKYSEFYNANVLGTQNIINACFDANIKRLLYVSSPSIFTDKHDRLNIREDDPVSSISLNDYIKTKKEAERHIDRAFQEGLPVITLRPQGIFGPGDTAVFPRLIRVAKSGSFPVIGNGKNQIDVTYVSNVVDALMLCSQSGPETIGKKFHITNGQPVYFCELVHKLFSGLKISYKTKKIPFHIAYNFAAGIERLYRMLPTKSEPALTRYGVCTLAKSRTLNISLAQQLLGYRPKVSVDEGFERFFWEEKGPHC